MTYESSGFVQEHRFRPANEAQEEFLNAEDKIVAYVGGLGSGKTHVGAFWAITMMLTYRNAQGLIAANTYKQLESATLPKVFQLLDEFGVRYHYNSQTKILRLRLKGFTGLVHCRSLSEYHDLRGIEFLWIWLDETRDTKEDAFKVVLGRLRQRVYLDGRPVPTTVPPTATLDLVPAKLRITTTPDMLKCKWLYDYLHNLEIRQKLSEDGISVREIKASSRENPYLEKDYIALLEASYDSELAKQEIEGDWVLIPIGKPVFGTSFVPKIHLGKYKFNPYKPLIIGLDWGYHHPAAVFCQEDTQDRWIVLGELLERDKETTEFCESIWKYINKHFPEAKDFETYCDPAGKQRTSKSRKSDIEIAREYKLYPICKKSEILDGIAIIRRKLGKLIAGLPALVVDEDHCPLLVEGFRGAYHYPEKTDPAQPDKLVPFKDGKYEHLFDALRYIGINKYQVMNPGPRSESQPVYDVVDPVTGY
jgi:hypothetical protein